MDTASLAHVAQQVEQELDRLRRARPHLENRLIRAERIIVAQLSLANGHRPIKVRLCADGTRAYSVRSGSKLKVAYNVDPATFECSCPWAESGGSGCSHSIACWLLARVVSDVPRAPSGATRQCDGCRERFPHRDLFDVPEGNLIFFEGEMVCRKCAAAHGVL
jgi:hypothetical protein